MNNLFKRFMHGASTCLIVLLSASYAHADDTEIFFGSASGNSVAPNIMFILDNSGSMDNWVSTQSTYDPSVTYSGTYSDDYIYVYRSGGDYWGKITKGNSACKAMLDSLASVGRYMAGQVAGYINNRWRNVLISEWTEYDVTECKADRTIHGETAASLSKYARTGYNKSTMWTSNSGQELNWGDISTRNFYSANYQNWYANHRTSTSKKRIDIMKDVVTSLVDSTSGINIGLMSFNTNNGGEQGGRVNVPIDNIASNKTDFKTKLNNLSPDTWTPLSETLFEAMRYYEGGNVFLGSQSVATSKDPSNSNKYKSPVLSECQPNNIVLLTDGVPTYDAHLSGSDYDSTDDAASRTAIQNTVGNCSGNCLDEIAKHMYDTDMFSSGMNGKQNVKTYTIGFNLDDPLLKLAAEGNGTAGSVGGGGAYFTADNAEDLDVALISIINEVKSTNTTFVTPGVAVNTFNRLNHRSELYFSVFKPEARPEWTGNLKKYILGASGVVKDANNIAAVDPDTGFFKETAKSYWSASADGSEVGLGGTASNLPSDNTERKVYTYTGSSDNLTDASNNVAADNTAITKAMLDIASASDAERVALIGWTRGMDVKDADGDGDRTEGRHVVMDPLHSPPVVVIYGGTDAEPDSTVFFGDNQGFLHAINAKNGTRSGYGNSEGEEYFSFIPAELLQNQKDIYDNSAASAHPYGLDGAITPWTYDANGDNQLNGVGDFVYLYTGMRRGGRNYYGLDVTSRTSPKRLWDIKGGASGTSGFEELGQTWSRPVKTKVKLGSTVKDVLIFSGGYDENQDDVTVRTVDSMGRAIYIVDAASGALIWSGGYSSSSYSSDFDETFADMKYSIPSSIRVIDINGDLLADQMYVGDMGGQVWRFDINNGSAVSALVDGGVVADLAGNTAASNRRFYHEPDVSIIKDGDTRKLAIAIGSGWQAHPLNQVVEDRFYMIKDPSWSSKPDDSDNDGALDYTDYTESDLYDATDNHLGHVSAVNTLAEQVQAHINLGQKHGWYIRLTRSGEKVLAASLTSRGEVYFTTYEPVPSLVSCSSAAGTPRLFHVHIADATPVKNYDGVGTDTQLTRPDRERVLKTTSIPTTPQIIRTPEPPADSDTGGPTTITDKLCIGTECGELDRTETLTRTYWLEEE